MNDPHTYGLAEWQAHQLKSMTPAQLEAEHAATSSDDYRALVAAEFQRRRLTVPDAPAPKPKRRRRK